MSGFVTLIARDLRLALRSGGDILTLILFFVMIGVVVPLAIGPDKTVLARLSPGLVWMAAFLSMLLGLDRLFRADADDGTLLALHHSTLPLPAIVGAKLIAHWLLTALPLLVASPMLAIMLNMDFPTFWRTLASLAIGTPALTALGAIGAAITVSLRRGGLLTPVLIFPLASPVLIFGVGAINGVTAATGAMMLLGAISLALVALAPFAAAMALNAGDD